MTCFDHQTEGNSPLRVAFLTSYLLIFLLTPSLAGAYSGGDGTPVNPYQIATVQDLIDLGQTEDDYFKSFVLTADIDLGDRVFERAVIAPDKGWDMLTAGIMLSYFDGMSFLGRFDGQGHVIRNLHIVNTDERAANYQGLFGMLSGGAEIANLGLEGVQINGHTYVGGLVGDNSTGTILSTYTTGTVSGVQHVGGLAGSNSGSISSSRSTCTVYGTRRVGGLVGDNIGPISLSRSTGNVYGSRGVGGLVGQFVGSETIWSSYSSARVQGTEEVGGLVGAIARSGTISSCCSTGIVSGRSMVGGLLGLVFRSGTILSSYSTARVHGTYYVGGLVGAFYYPGTVSSSYSSGRVFGARDVGGLVGGLVHSGTTVLSSFWDIESSEQTESVGGVGLTIEQMQDGSTYMQAGWDLTFHPLNNPDAIWWMPEPGTPRLWWEYGWAQSPNPVNHASTHLRDLTLQWSPGGQDIQHDVYFGEDEGLVANADTASQDVFLGRLQADTLTYDLYGLEPGTTYFWRIDGVNDLDPAKVWQGPVWSFTITDFITVKVLDDFESYDDHCNRIFFTWQDGWGHSGGENIDGCDVAPYEGNGTGAVVGNVDPPYASQIVVHKGSQCLPIHYDNENGSWFSETQRTWPEAQDWTTREADALTLYFRGEAENAQDRLYIAVEDNRAGTAVVEHLSESAVLATEWQVWHIPLADLDAAGVDVSAIEKLVIGVGDRDNPQASGRGLLYVDDIQLTKQVP